MTGQISLGFPPGDVVIVTGAGSGIGRATATNAAAIGLAVAAWDMNADGVARTVRDIEDAGGRAVAVTADVTSDTQVAAALDASGTARYLVNNAGPFSMTPYSALPEAEWDRIWDSNAKASYVASQCVADGMRRRGWGRIVNISAGSAYLRNHSVYGLSKEAIIFLTEELALELGPEVTVNAVAPGQIAESADDIAEFDPTFVERAVRHTPAGRLVTRAEVAAIVAMLCSPAFDMVTGATVPVDGGWRLNRF